MLREVLKYGAVGSRLDYHSWKPNPSVLVIPQTSELFERALGRYQAMIDKNRSLTDCASFLIMEADSIEAALTHDRHFAHAGFQTLLR